MTVIQPINPRFEGIRTIDGLRWVDPRDKYPWVWDYGLSQADFDAILAGDLVAWGHLDRDWAAVRLIEYTPYPEMIRRIGFRALEANWERWRGKVRADEQKRGLDFVVFWLRTHRRDLIGDG